MPDLFHTPAVFPPLGKSTAVTVKDGKIRLYALMTVSTVDASLASRTEQQHAPVAVDEGTSVIKPEDRFTVLLWYSVDGRGTWKPAKFKEIKSEDAEVKLFQLQRPESSRSKRQDLFRLDLPWSTTHPVEFCLKYSYGDGPWNWAGPRTGLTRNGRLLVLPPLADGLPPLSDSGLGGRTSSGILPLLPREWASKQLNSPDQVSAWCLSHASPSSTSLCLGPPGMLENWLVLVKISTPWMIPRHGGQVFQCPLDALMLLMQRKDGRKVLVLPVSGEEGTRYVQSDANAKGEVMIRALEDASSTKSKHYRTTRVIVVAGEDVKSVLDVGFGHLKSLVHPSRGPFDQAALSRKTSSTSDQLAALHLKRVDWEKGLSYCTWNGLGWNLSEARLLDALQKLHNAGIHIRNLLIDDNWQSLRGRNYGSSGTWSRFEADEGAFPGGLKKCVDKIRRTYPYIRHIGVWHALHGYWDGITPDSELGQEYKTVQLDWLDNVNDIKKKLCFVHPDDIERFYDDFYRFLADCGVDSAKVDVQCRIDELVNETDRGMLQKSYSDALRKASIKHFDSRVIYCMSHVPQVLYQALLPPDGPRRMLRTSDDFYPNMPSSHAFHVFANSHNMLLFSRLHILPDWDMFQTTLSVYAPLHAVARCLSGGPIFITDAPGSYDTSILSRMCARSPLGTTITLQPKGMATSVDPFMAYTDDELLKIHNSTRHSRVVGVFNISTKPVTELVDCSAVFRHSRSAGVDQAVIRAYSTGKVRLSRRSDGDAFLVAGLPPSGWEIYTAVAVEQTRLASGEELGVAVFGLTRNYTGAAAVENWRILQSGGAHTLEIELNALGNLAVYIRGMSSRVSESQLGIHLQGIRLERRYFKWLETEADVLEVSVGKAWGDLKLSSESPTCLVSIALQ